MRKTLAVGRKEFRQIARDRRSLMVLLFVPAFFLLLYGYALSFDVQNIQLAVQDNDRSQASRDLVNAFVKSGYFQLAADVSSSREYEEMIDRGDARAALVIPAGLQRDLLTGHRVPVQVIINGDNSNTATTVMGYALSVLQTASAKYQAQTSTRLAAPLITVESRVWYNPQLRSALFLIPGLIAYIGMISAVISTSLSVVREKERGTMEQVRMAPLGTGSYIIGKTLPYFVISLATSVFIVVASMLLFRLPMNGSWLLLASGALAVSRRRVGARTDDLHHRGIAAGRVSDRRARVVPADDDAVWLRVSNCQHAGADSSDHLRRPRPLLHRRAPLDRAQRRGAVGVLGRARRARGVCGAHADARVEAIGEAMGMRRIWFVMWKEIIELRQDPRIFGIIFIAPVLQLAILGYAATTDVRNVPIVVVDADRSPGSQDLISRFTGSGIFDIVDVVSDTRDVDRYLESGDAWMALAIPASYGRNIAAGRPTTLQVVADGSDANSTNIALGYASNLIAGYTQEMVEERRAAGAPAGGGGGSIEPRVRVWFNPTLESRYFMLPGIFALLLLVVTSNLSSMAIVREREVGTLEQLNVTPLGRMELIIGKLLPYGIIGLIDVLIVLVVIVFWFEVPLRGSFWLLFGMSLIYLLTTLGLGLFTSTISHTQQQAMMTSTFFFLIPMMYLSGFIFPIENMPAVIQPITYLIPLRYFVVILRGIFLKGVGLETLWPQALALLGWGVVILTLAYMRSSKRLA